jgi:hypothetical protein
MPPGPRDEVDKEKPMSNTWTGEPLTLEVDDSAEMPQTPNGSTVLAWRNVANLNNQGTLALTSGGQPPEILDAPAFPGFPSLLARNWQANPLTIANISTDPATPIWIQMFGFGLPGEQPIPLPVGTPTTLAPLQTALGRGLDDMQLVMKSNSANLTSVAVIGGPADSSGNNAYLFALNYAGRPAPPGYTAVTASNSYTFQFNWGMSSIFVADLSSENSVPVQVLLQSR